MILKYTNKMQREEIIKLAHKEGFDVQIRDGVVYIDEEHIPKLEEEDVTS